MGEGNLFPDCQASPSESSVLCTISIWKRRDISVIRGDNIEKPACYIIEVLELPRENCALDVGCLAWGYMGAVLKPLFTFYIKPENVRSKMSAFLWSRKIRESTAKGPAKG